MMRISTPAIESVIHAGNPSDSEVFETDSDAEVLEADAAAPGAVELDVSAGAPDTPGISGCRGLNASLFLLSSGMACFQREFLG
jgi:hypothetical protein